ncbi:MAG: choice-of-anchor B family protein [Woeseiaceae bacterium]|nr:choice-of-anchor B family protein [Woeseiaceae bacterium]
MLPAGLEPPCTITFFADADGPPMHPNVLLVALALSLLAAARPAAAHGDASIPLYVAGNGTDTGRCDDPAAPCRTISYALRQAGKGTQIRVAAGRYPIDNHEDLFLLISGVVDVVGGFDRQANFRSRGNSISTLTGIPPVWRNALRERGFHVIADSKGFESEADAARTTKLLGVHQQLKSGATTGPCVDGTAGSLDCDAVDLIGHVAFEDVSAGPTRANDVWGFTDLNTGREYAIVGFNVGTGVFDVTDPENLREVGFVDGQTASWRDIKIYQHHEGGRWITHAYVTTDGSTDGLFVIDLTGLPHSIRRAPYASQFLSAHNVYTTNTDFATGLSLTGDAPQLIIAGSNLGTGQFRAYSLAQPSAPQLVQGTAIPNSFDGGDSSYMHDAASLLITDSRKDTQCVNAGDYCELLLDFNEENVEVWDITDPADPERLNPGRQQYAQRGYVHSGWWSEDRQFMFVHDELDEQRFGINTTLRIFSISDLSNPQLAGTWTGPTAAIDHNGFVRGNRYYMSNYSRGLTILDISDPAAPATVGRLDTYPFSDQGGFVGAWGAYPYFMSGTVAVSDINSGLYLARDRTRDVAAGRFGFDAASYAVAEGQSLQIGIERQGGSSGAVAATLEIVHATADPQDYAMSTVSVDWPDGDAGTRVVGLDAINDTVTEPLESVLVKLVDPRGGATLADRNTVPVYLGDPGEPAGVRLFEDNIEVTERGFGSAIIVLHRTGDATAAASVDYAASAGTAAAGSDFGGAASGTVTWPAGDGRPRWLEFPVNDDGIAEDDEYVDIEFSNAQGATLAGSTSARVTIKDGSGTNLAPNAVVASSVTAAEGTLVTLDGSQSNDSDGDTLSYAWAQTSGPPVRLDNAASTTVSFTAPAVDSDALLRFSLTVSDPGGLADSATVAVTITNGDAASGGSGSGGAAGMALLLLLLAPLTSRWWAGRIPIRTGAA